MYECPECGALYPDDWLRPIRCNHIHRSRDYTPALPETRRPSPEAPHPNGRCSCGYQASSSITQTIQCPLCGEDIFVRSKEDQGRHAWEVLHTKKNPARQWYENEWKPLIPKYGCRCQSDFAKIEAADPPTFESQQAYDRWAHRVHNAVRRKLGQPEFTWQEAKERWHLDD